MTSPRRYDLRIWDILNAVNKIISFVKGMDPDEFEADSKTIAAVTYQFIVIGEASRQLPDDFKRQHPNLPWRYMQGMRDFISHEYWGVDREILWTAAKVELPPLVKPLEAILKQLKSEQ